MGDEFVEDAELGFHFGELVLEVQEDAVVEVCEFAVERGYLRARCRCCTALVGFGGVG